jgi:hypothetical protein
VTKGEWLKSFQLATEIKKRICGLDFSFVLFQSMYLPCRNIRCNIVASWLYWMEQVTWKIEEHKPLIFFVIFNQSNWQSLRNFGDIYRHMIIYQYWQDLSTWLRIKLLPIKWNWMKRVDTQHTTQSLHACWKKTVLTDELMMKKIDLNTWHTLFPGSSW